MGGLLSKDVIEIIKVKADRHNRDKAMVGNRDRAEMVNRGRVVMGSRGKLTDKDMNIQVDEEHLHSSFHQIFIQCLMIMQLAMVRMCSG